MSESGSKDSCRFPFRGRVIGFILIFMGLWLSLLSQLPAAEEKKDAGEKVEAVADQLEYARTEKKILAKGNVVLTYQDMKLTADYAEVETETKKAYARGHVVLLRGEILAAKGEEIYYDFADDRGSFPDGRIVNWPWFSRGQKVEQIAKGKVRIENARTTTCDLERPHYEIRAKRAAIYTGDKIVAHNITLHVLGKPVFWWPYLVIPLQYKLESPIQIQPGYSSEYGGYILTSKAFGLTKWLWGRWHADWRSKRGFGGGADFDYSLSRLKSEGRVQMYLTQDRRAPSVSLAEPYDEREHRARGRLSWKHRADFGPHTNLILRFHRLADEFFLQDFFQKEFRSDVEPSSFVTLTHNTDRYGFYAFNQKRVNSFENVTERTPEIRFDWKNAPFFRDRLYYESASSLANLNQKFSRSETDQQNFRFDTFHEWTLPLKWKEISLTPSLNLHETLYAREKQESDPQARSAFGGAVDLRAHFYRVFNTSFDSLGIEANQLRHVVEPLVRYDTIFLSNVGNDRLFQFDSIDGVDESKKITFGLENRIQTKRIVRGKIERVDLVSLNTFMSHDFHPDEVFSRRGLWSLTGELQLRPYEWLQYEVRFQYDTSRNTLRDFNQDLLAKTERFSFLFGHRRVAREDFLNVEGSNQFVFDIGYWINERWKVGSYFRWDAEDLKLQEWQISATRDLHDFLLDFGYNVRNSRIHKVNKELFFVFRLKAFPEYSLKSGSRASFSEPRIGTTVAGSN